MSQKWKPGACLLKKVRLSWLVAPISAIVADAAAGVLRREMQLATLRAHEAQALSSSWSSFRFEGVEQSRRWWSKDGVQCAADVSKKAKGQKKSEKEAHGTSPRCL